MTYPDIYSDSGKAKKKRVAEVRSIASYIYFHREDAHKYSGCIGRHSAMEEASRLVVS